MIFNIALGLAFLISHLGSPGGKLLSMVLEPGAFRSLPPYQGLLAGVIANNVLPAILIYLMLKVLRAESYLRPGVAGRVLFTIPNAILCLYAVLRVLASTVEGGGATFVLASMGAPVILAAVSMLGAAAVWVAIRSVWMGVRIGPEKLHARDRMFKGGGETTALLMALPAVAFLAWLYVANAEKFEKVAGARRAVADRLEELCLTSTRIDIYRRANGAESVFFPMPTNATFALVDKLAFVEAKRGWTPKGKPPYERLSKKPGEKAYVRGVLNSDRVEVAQPQAQYEISARPIESAMDTKLGLYVEETTVRDRRSNEVLAVFTAVGERRTVARGDEPFCPRGFEYVRYQTEVPSYVLGLMDEKASRDFERRMAAAKSKIAGGARK